MWLLTAGTLQRVPCPREWNKKRPCKLPQLSGSRSVWPGLSWPVRRVKSLDRQPDSQPWGSMYEFAVSGPRKRFSRFSGNPPRDAGGSQPHKIAVRRVWDTVQPGIGPCRVIQLTRHQSLTNITLYNLVEQDLYLIQSGRGTGPKTPRQPPGK